MVNTACMETAAVQLDSSLADSTTIRFADEGSNASPHDGSKETILCVLACAAAVLGICIVLCIVADV